MSIDRCWVADSNAFLRYGFAMTVDYLSQYWALLLAAVIGTGVLPFVLFRVYQDSVPGRLRACVSQMRLRERAAQKAHTAVDKADGSFDRLQADAKSVSPRRLQEAIDARDDARALRKIADDQVLVARNHVRKIILEDYPPKRHAAMRSRYLQRDETENKPFRMGEYR